MLTSMSMGFQDAFHENHEAGHHPDASSLLGVGEDITAFSTCEIARVHNVLATTGSLETSPAVE
jgi:hypothetical protein